MTDLFATAESPQTDAAVSLVSGSRQLERAILGLSVTRDLMAEGARDPGVASAVVDRVEALAKRTADRRYANPADAALTVYLFVLRRIAPAEAETASKLAVEAPNCYWAPRVAEATLAELAPSRTYRWSAITGPRHDVEHGDSDTSVLSAKRSESGDSSHVWRPSDPSETTVLGSGPTWTSVGTASCVSRQIAA